MKTAPVAFVILVVVSALICVWYSAYAQQRRRIRGASEFSFFAITAAIYTLGYAFELQAHSIEAMRVIVAFEGLGMGFLPTFWLLFSLKFALDREPGPRFRAFLFIVPALLILAMWTNQFHHLYYRETFLAPEVAWPAWGKVAGPLFLAWNAWSQALLVGGLAVILRRGFRVKGRARLQSLLIAAAITIPWLSDLAYIMDLVPAGLDPVPFAISLAGAFLGFSLFRFGLLELVPAARESAIEGLRDGFLVFDREGNVADANAAGRAYLGKVSVGEPLSPDLPGAAEIGDLLREGRGIRSFSALSALGEELRLEVHADPVSDARGRRTGVSLAIRDVTETAALLKRLSDLASLDPLTEVLNRRRFHELAQREFGLALRSSRVLAVIILDLDHFKTVNDLHGHSAGDEVLRTAARRLSVGLRVSDLFARYGGEEFAVLLPDTPVEGALHVAERMRLELTGEAVRFEGRDIIVTASFGVFAGTPRSADSIETYLARADEALYVAKAEGRNAVRAWKEGALEALRDGHVTGC